MSGDNDVAAAAGIWVARVDRGLTPAESAEFATWKAQSPAHTSEYERIARTWAVASELSADADWRELARTVDATTRAAAERRRHPRGLWLWSGGLAAAAMVLAGFWLQMDRVALPSEALNPQSVASVPGQAYRLDLPDGSKVEVRAESEVSPAFTATERRVRLVRGRAYFQVAKDATRPFLVEVGGLAVRAVGTAFEVRWDAAAIEVSVDEGKVSLQDADASASLLGAPVLGAGEMTRIETSSGAIGMPSQLVIAPIAGGASGNGGTGLSGRNTRIFLNRTPLSEALATFNRLGNQRIEVGDANVGSRQLSGSFGIENADALIRLLEQASEVRVERRSDGVIVLHSSR